MLSYLKGFIEKYPHIKITIENQSTTHTLSMLEQQRIDVGLVAEPKFQKNIQFLPVLEIEDIFVAAPKYMENLKLREGTEADIFHVGNIMLLNKENITRSHIDEYMSINGITANNLLEVSTMDLLIEFARIGLGIGCVIKEFVKDDLDSGRLAEIKLNQPVRKRTVGFAYHANRTSRALETFIQFCKEQKGPSA